MKPSRKKVILSAAAVLIGVGVWFALRPSAKPTAPAPLVQSTPAPAIEHPVPAPVVVSAPVETSATLSTDLPAPALAPVESRAAVLPVAAATMPFAVQPVDEPTQPVVATTPQAPKKINEVAATRRMYAAHAPLRAPAVANPDSAENNRILQTMVVKALQHARTPAAQPPSPSSGTRR